MRDAILAPDGSEPDWPDADAIIGNPPFLGNKGMIGTLGEDYTARLRRIFTARLSGGVDLVTYWFEKARAMIEAGRTLRAGLVGTQAVRRGASRQVLDRITATTRIFDAWGDEPWIVDGAAVRVSLVCFGEPPENGPMLNGVRVPAINADLTGGAVDLTAAKRLRENARICFQGPVKVGSFDTRGDLARHWLLLPLNPNGRPNADVIRPWINGRDVTRRPSDTWIIDFGELSHAEAALYAEPFAYIEEHVKPVRQLNRRGRRKERWWQHGETVPGLRIATRGLKRFFVTPRVARHRVFVWRHSKFLPDSRVVVIAHDDNVTFGILHSRSHEIWSLRLGGWHGVGNDPQYMPTTTFETFPFPEWLTPHIPAGGRADDPRAQRIAAAAVRLNELRENWLNPPDLVVRVPEVVPGYPERILPRDEECAKELKKRTLTKLYNQRPAWLDNLHKELDSAVAAAYGWPADLTDEEILARLFELNQARAGRSKLVA